MTCGTLTVIYGARASRSITVQEKMDLRILISSESQRIVTISFHLFYLRADQRVSRPGLVTRYPRPRPVAGYGVRLLVRGLVKFQCAVA